MSKPSNFHMILNELEDLRARVARLEAQTPTDYDEITLTTKDGVSQIFRGKITYDQDNRTRGLWNYVWVPKDSKADDQ